MGIPDSKYGGLTGVSNRQTAFDMNTVEDLRNFTDDNLDLISAVVEANQNNVDVAIDALVELEAKDTLRSLLTEKPGGRTGLAKLAELLKKQMND